MRKKKLSREAKGKEPAVSEPNHSESSEEIAAPQVFKERNSAAKQRSLSKLPSAPLDNVSFHLPECVLKWNAVAKRAICAEREVALDTHKAQRHSRAAAKSQSAQDGVPIWRLLLLPRPRIHGKPPHSLLHT